MYHREHGDIEENNENTEPFGIDASVFSWLLLISSVVSVILVLVFR